MVKNNILYPLLTNIVNNDVEVYTRGVHQAQNAGPNPPDFFKHCAQPARTRKPKKLARPDPPEK